jgi:hypothetical protein
MDAIFSTSCAAGAVLLLPVPCSSGISRPSLAIDLLLNSYPSKRVAVSKSPLVQPFVSSAAIDSSTPGAVAAALELHSLADGIFAVQQRAPLFDGCAAAFMDSMLQWLRLQPLSKLVLIAEAPAHRKVDVFLHSGAVFTVQCAAAGDGVEAGAKSGGVSAASVSSDVGCRALGENSFASRFMAQCSSSLPSLSCLFTFSSGDPVASSLQLAQEAAMLSGAAQCTLRQPASWSLSLLPPIDQSIFG